MHNYNAIILHHSFHQQPAYRAIYAIKSSSASMSISIVHLSLMRISAKRFSRFAEMRYDVKRITASRFGKSFKRDITNFKPKYLRNNLLVNY